MNNGFNNHYYNYPSQRHQYPGQYASYDRPRYENYNYAREMEQIELERALKESLRDARPQGYPGNLRQSSVDEVQLQQVIQESLRMNPTAPTNHYNDDSNMDEMLKKALQESLNDQKPPYKNPDMSKSRSFEKQQQDSEYEIAEQKAIRERIEKNRNKTMEEELKEACKASSEINRQEKINRVLTKSKYLPSEPEKGILIAVVLPNNKRITRKFDVSEIADDVYTWVAMEHFISKEEEFPDFKLSTNMNQVLNPDQTLESQGITKRVLFNALTE